MGHFIRKLAQAGGGGLSAGLFWLCVVAGVCLQWVCWHGPFVDLPQHAGQISALRDMLRGQFIWMDLVRVDLLTPYLTGYFTTALLSLLMPVEAALALVLSLAFMAYIVTGLRLRRFFGAAPALDFLLIPSFFGVTWQWGSFNFLVAVPLVFLMVEQAVRYTRTHAGRDALRLLILGLLILISHHLAFGFACLVAGLFYLVSERRRLDGRITHWLLAGWPFALFAFLLVLPLLKEATHVYGGERLVMGSYLVRLQGLIQLPFYGDHEGKWSPIFTLIWATPFLMKLRWQTSPYAYVPFVAVLLVWFALPAVMYGTYFLYPRFSIYLLPFLSLMFKAEPSKQASARPDVLGLTALIILVTIYLGHMAWRLHEFNLEQQDFSRLQAALELQQRMFMYVGDPSSSAFGHVMSYVNWPLWYQVDQGGWVDLNFAIFHPQPVKYREAKPDLFYFYDNKGLPYDWQRLNGASYRYFVFRGQTPLVQEIEQKISSNPDCLVRAAGTYGSWRLYERVSCKD